MGRYCKICGYSRPNEQFGGRGLRAVICKKCRTRPKPERERILATDEVYGFLDQSNISAKNINRLQELDSIEHEPFQQLRSLVLAIAHVKPGKKRRWKVLRAKHRNLFDRLVESGLFDHLLDEAGIWFEPMSESATIDSEDWKDVWWENTPP
jgi:hypothetical protein